MPHFGVLMLRFCVNVQAVTTFIKAMGVSAADVLKNEQLCGEFVKPLSSLVPLFPAAS